MNLHILIQIIFLIVSVSAADARSVVKSGCLNKCGDVSIPHPFGIGKGCYQIDEWYEVTCDNSTNKPFLSKFNMEILAVDVVYSSITVMNPVASNCERQKGNNIIWSSAKFTGTPFSFDTYNNKFVVVGCDSALLFDYQIGYSCLPRCEPGTSVQGCQTWLPEFRRLEFYTISFEESKTIGFTYAFLIQADYLMDMSSINTTKQVPVVIQYYENLRNINQTRREDSCANCKNDCYKNQETGDFQCGNRRQTILVSVSAADARSVVKSSYLTKCGNVSIPHPFGIGKGCYQIDEWYEVTCNNSTNKPFLSKFNMEILAVDVDISTVTVMNPVASNCERQKGNTIWSSANLSGTPFFFRSFIHKFVVVGCDSALLFDYQLHGYSCLPRCEPGNSVQGCQTWLPSSYDVMYFYTISFEESKTMGCTYAFLIQDEYLTDMSSINTTKQVPVVISYFDYDRNNPNVTNKGDDYDVACANCKKDCYRNQETGDFQCGNRREIILASSLGGGLLFLLLCGFCFWMYKVIKKKRIANLKKKFFKRNGGLLLEQQISSYEGTVSKTILFTADQLLKATDNYNGNRILGQGGQGTVYKGMLTDGRITAVKKSNVVDESQLGQFINEVIILSQMDHRNIVKLLGCCLETEVPLLVYEFVLNGTLSDFIHNANEEFPLSWKMRLKIATEVAGALAYLHSASSVPIYHRDIKSTNILLDEKFRAKIADFGTSRSITIEQSHLTTVVYGTFGYLDPEYFQSSQFTDKSDVYSFGVVLAELLTGQKAVSLSETEEERSLAARFVLYANQMRVTDIVDARVLEEAPKEDILAVSDIARRCLNLNGKMRPTMKEVTRALEVMSREPIVAAPTILNQETFDIEMRNRIKDQYSTSTMIMSDYEAFPSSETDPLMFYSY